LHATQKVNFIRYADDFIVTGKSKRLLEEKVKPAVEKFLAERGLSLSEEKTMFTYIKNGFTFLGQTFRKHGRKLHITPSKEGVLALVRKLGMLIRKHVSAPIPILIKKLNQVLRGWANYHRHVVSSEAFSRIDTYVFEQLWRMLRNRHPRKSRKWLFKKYWTASGKKHIFAVIAKTKKNSISLILFYLVKNSAYHLVIAWSLFREIAKDNTASVLITNIESVSNGQRQVQLMSKLQITIKKRRSRRRS